MCQFCECTNQTLYQQNTYGNLYFDHLGRNAVLVVKPTICPPYSTCSAKDVERALAFKIKYCPECGRQLQKGD